MSTRHRAGFIGAGHISTFHAEALRRIPGVELAGVYDIDAQRAQQAARTLNTRAFSSVNELESAQIDVVHVLTPPEAHVAAALDAIAIGAHVLVEKPLATDVEDCRRIAAAAKARGVRVCVDHSLLYDPQVRRALDAVRRGAVGRVVSVSISRSSDYPVYEGGPLPPQYRSAGYPFRDLGIHQLYLLQAFLGSIENVRADWRSIGGDPNLTFDEWTAVVRCRDGFGTLHVSFNVRPIQNIIVVHGTKGVLRIDPMSMFSSKRASTPFPKAAERAINAFAESLEPMVEVPKGIVGFLRKSIRPYQGVQELVREFYRSLDDNLPVPVSVDEAIPVVDWVERVARTADADAAARAAIRAPLSVQVPIVVTGANGGLGSAVVARLQEGGQRYRIFVRRQPDNDLRNGEVATGDLGDPNAVDDAIRGARVVIHIGAATKGGWSTQHASTVVGTRNVIEACLRYGVDQLIYISSLSVVNWGGQPDGAVLDEFSPLERRPHARGAYTRAKLEAELLVREAVENRGLPAVILRPGQIFGGKLPLINAAFARRLGKYSIVLGDGTLRLPLVYIDDVVDAILAAMNRRVCQGQIIQLVDDHLPTQNEVLARALEDDAKIVRVPHPILFSIGWLSELVLGALKRDSPISRYRLRSALARRTYRSNVARRDLEWVPRTGVYAGIERSLLPEVSTASKASATYATIAL